VKSVKTTFLVPVRSPRFTTT